MPENAERANEARHGNGCICLNFGVIGVPSRRARNNVHILSPWLKEVLGQHACQRRPVSVRQANSAAWRKARPRPSWWAMVLMSASLDGHV